MAIPMRHTLWTITAALLLPLIGCATQGRSSKDSIKQPDSIGVAWLEPDRTLVMQLRAESKDKALGDALLRYKPDDPQYHRMLDQIRAVDLAAIRQLESGPEEQSLLDVAFDPEEGPHARLERAEMREHLARAILEIPARERHILSLYYEHELTLAEIGEVIGVGESRVSQLRTQAIARLRSRLRESLQIAEVR